VNVEKLPDGSLRVEFDLKQGNELAAAVIRHAEDMPSALLELSSLLRAAWYEARNTFEQPPHAFDDRAPPHPSM
jgi:hypothetical protein